MSVVGRRRRQLPGRRLLAHAGQPAARVGLHGGEARHAGHVEAALVHERGARERRQAAAVEADQRANRVGRVEIVAVDDQERPCAHDRRGGRHGGGRAARLGLHGEVHAQARAGRWGVARAQGA